MAMYDDDNFGGIFPRRTGVPTGAANERKMLDAIGGSEGIRTQQKTNLDGSITMLRTRNGMPEFSRTEPVRRGGTPRYLRCRMMSELYPRGADVLLIDGAYATQNANYSWPDNTSSVGLLSPGRPYRGVRDEAVAWRTPAAPQTWYDNRPRGSRQFEDTLSWDSISQQRNFITIFPYALRSYYESLFGLSTAVGKYIPGDGDSYGLLYQEYIGATNYLYRNAVSTGISGHILAACAVVEFGVVTYRTLQGELPTDGSKPNLAVVDYAENGDLISTASVSYPAGLESTQLAGTAAWNRSGTQACVLLTKNNLVLIEADGSAALWPFPYTSRETRTSTLSTNYDGYIVHRGVFYRYSSNTFWFLSYTLEGAGYNGDDLLTIVREIEETAVGDFTHDAESAPFPAIPYPSVVWVWLYANTVTTHTEHTETNRIFIHQTGEVLASATPFDDMYRITENWSIGADGYLHLTSSSSTRNVGTRNDYVLMHCDFQQKTFFIRDNTATDLGGTFSIGAYVGGNTFTILPTTALGYGMYKTPPSAYEQAYSNYTVEIIPPTIHRYSFAEAVYTLWVIHLSATIDRDSLAIVASVLYSTGPSIYVVPLADLQSANKVCFKVGNGWSIEDLKLPTYDGTVKWLSELLISEF